MSTASQRIRHIKAQAAEKTREHKVFKAQAEEAIRERDRALASEAAALNARDDARAQRNEMSLEVIGSSMALDAIRDEINNMGLQIAKIADALGITVDGHTRAEALVDQIIGRITDIQAQNERALSLVRLQRHELLEQNAITMNEFAKLAEQSNLRGVLETHDALRSNIAEYQKLDTLQTQQIIEANELIAKQNRRLAELDAERNGS